MARAVEAEGMVDERGEGVGFWRRDEEIIFADDEIDAVWTRGVRKRKPRWSKTRNDARACARNIIRWCE
jgi:hypothetical protein